MRILPKDVESLWTLFTAPAVWAVHFLLCYAGAAIYCAKREALDFSFDAVRMAIAAITAAALLMILVSAYLAWRQWGFGTEEPPHDDPTRRDRNRFQGFATLLLSGLSFVAVIYVAMPILFIRECWR